MGAAGADAIRARPAASAKLRISPSSDFEIEKGVFTVGPHCWESINNPLPMMFYDDCCIVCMDCFGERRKQSTLDRSKTSQFAFRVVIKAATTFPPTLQETELRLQPRFCSLRLTPTPPEATTKA